jgi:hypothetical protein
VLVDKVQGVAREVVGVTARFAFDEVSVLVSCGVDESVFEDSKINKIEELFSRATSHIRSEEMFERSAIMKSSVVLDL